MVSRPGLGSDPPIGSDRDSGRDNDYIQINVKLFKLKSMVFWLPQQLHQKLVGHFLQAQIHRKYSDCASNKVNLTNFRMSNP